MYATAEALRDSLRRYATRVVGIDRADDVVQETFLRLWAAQSPPRDEHLAQWLFTVCRNIGMDIRRKEARMSPLPESHAEGRRDSEPPPPVVAQRRESVSAVLSALESLSPDQQETVRLRFQNGFSYKQIAEITGLSATNVGFVIHTAIKAIRQKLGAELPAGKA